MDEPDKCKLHGVCALDLAYDARCSMDVGSREMPTMAGSAGICQDL